VRVLDGRFGPYVTDGWVNASLPRGTDPGELTLEHAVELLRERAARAPAKKAGRPVRKPTAKKAPAKKAPAKKSSAKKATAKQATAKKATTRKATKRPAAGM
jgi:DNA topoisomerase-1